nr:hypothetical protein [Tanacetum cinerariifolium]
MLVFSIDGLALIPIDTSLLRNSNFMVANPVNTSALEFKFFGRHAFVQGISVALDDSVELVEVGSGCVSSGPNDVVVALSAGEKGDGLDPSSAAGEEGRGAWYAGEHLLLQA